MNVTMRNDAANVALTSLAASTAKAIEWPEGDSKMILVVQNGGNSAVTLTVKAGNGLQGVADHTVSLPIGVNLIKLESGRFKNVSGENKGKIVISASGAVSVGTAALV